MLVWSHECLRRGFASMDLIHSRCWQELVPIANMFPLPSTKAMG